MTRATRPQPDLLIEAEGRGLYGETRTGASLGCATKEKSYKITCHLWMRLQLDGPQSYKILILFKTATLQLKKNRVQPLKESQYWGVTPEYFECFNIGWCGAPLVSRQVGFLATNTTSASYCTLQLLKSSNSIGGGGELYPTR